MVVSFLRELHSFCAICGLWVQRLYSNLGWVGSVPFLEPHVTLFCVVIERDRWCSNSLRKRIFVFLNLDPPPKYKAELLLLKWARGAQKVWAAQAMRPLRGQITGMHKLHFHCGWCKWHPLEYNRTTPDISVATRCTVLPGLVQEKALELCDLIQGFLCSEGNPWN